MCTVLLPPGVNPIAVNKYIDINIITAGSFDNAQSQLFGPRDASCNHRTVREWQWGGWYHRTVREWHWGRLISWDRPGVARAGWYHRTVREWHWDKFRFRISVSPISIYCLNALSSLRCFRSASTLLLPRSSAATWTRKRGSPGPQWPVALLTILYLNCLHKFSCYRKLTVWIIVSVVLYKRWHFSDNVQCCSVMSRGVSL